MSTKTEKTVKIGILLFEEWDPIGLKHIGFPNQYHRYAREIVSQFSEAPQENAIFDYLKHACQKRMGMALNNQDWSETRSIAERIILLLNNEN